ncbi:ferritin-like domain-containing protein [Aestuariivirga sp.]|uniref:ferritin-like domain-containing protein n=1 Tax=Aestuariivirga sp. TaxID=2650926 RepID=UPI003BAA1CEC
MSAGEVYSVLATPDTAKGAVQFQKSPGMTWRDYLITLLHLAAQVEHGLMVQYLYAAYSLGHPGLKPDQSAEVRGWQKNILEVAKEEMGHLLTVQNLLALLGAPPSFTRAQTAFEEALSPIPFVLDPLSRDVAASFTFAEMSPELEAHLKSSAHLREGLEEFLKHHQLRPIRKETKRLSKDLGFGKVTPQPVALLYEEIIRVFSDPNYVPDSDLDEMSYEAQASWDDWGRGYAPDPKLLSPTGDILSQNAGSTRANVIVMRAATRAEALLALRAISGQGEAVHLQHPHKLKRKQNEDDEDQLELSHFERFLTIWQHYPQHWRPYRRVIRNPATRPTVALHQTRITDPAVLDWALLFNLRYRMLLTFLAHSFRLSRVVRPGTPNLRGMVMHRAFGEMYNLKTIAGLLVQMKVGEDDDGDIFAGPPFETPYTLNMPAAHVDTFRLHRDLYTGSMEIVDRLQSNIGPLGGAYLQSLLELDHAALGWIDGILRAPQVRTHS